MTPVTSSPGSLAGVLFARYIDFTWFALSLSFLYRRKLQLSNSVIQRLHISPLECPDPYLPLFNSMLI